MKNIDEIIARAVILLTVSDRASLEKPKINGNVYSVEQRDRQRLSIYKWLNEKGYSKMMTQEERSLFEQNVGGIKSNQILSNINQYEAIEPCLWAIGLVTEISNYHNFVLDDFHPILQIGPEHTLGELVPICRLRSRADILIQREIAMLWHWRAIEGNNPIFKSKSLIEIVSSVFGSQYLKVVENIKLVNGCRDFVVDGYYFYELNKELINRIKCISGWRYHALEWLVGDVAWDEVETNT